MKFRFFKYRQRLENAIEQMGNRLEAHLQRESDVMRKIERDHVGVMEYLDKSLHNILEMREYVEKSLQLTLKVEEYVDKSLSHVLRSEERGDKTLHLSTLIKEFTEKSLYLGSQHFDLYRDRSARPYFSMNDNWALTFLDTGSPFFINTDDRIVAPWIIMGGHWETSVDRVMTTYAKPGMSIVDVGAHCGYYTVKLAMCVGSGGSVLAFDPNPDIVEFCKANIKLNGLQTYVKLKEVALSDVNGSATMVSRPGESAGASIAEAGPDFTYQVAVSRLDDMEDLVLPIDLMKIDAEGNEAKILRGAQKVLAQSPNCAVIMELSLDRWEKQAPLSDLMALTGGGGREIFGIHQDSTVENIKVENLEQFVNQRSHREEYVVIATPEIVAANLSGLIR